MNQQRSGEPTPTHPHITRRENEGKSDLRMEGVEIPSSSSWLCKAPKWPKNGFFNAPPLPPQPPTKKKKQPTQPPTAARPPQPPAPAAERLGAEGVAAQRQAAAADPETRHQPQQRASIQAKLGPEKTPRFP